MSPATVQHLPMIGLTPRSTEVTTAENTPTTVVNSIDLAGAIGQALSRAGLNNKQACAYMEIDPGLWSRQLQGDGHISFQRLLKLPVKFWTEFVPLLAEPVGLACSNDDLADRAVMQSVFALEQALRAQMAVRAARRTA